MKSLILLIILIIAAIGISYFVNNEIGGSNNGVNNNTGIVSSQGNKIPEESVSVTNQSAEQADIDLGLPLLKAKERVTKKPFGIHITSQNSPVQPERFSGYHTGTDFEILSGEEDIDVEVRAICDGKITFRNQVNGYGGVIIESCAINKQTVTVLYGHVSLTKSPAASNKEYKAGDVIAVLGQGYSVETDGERKHLHLGIHKGSAIDYLGYVQNKKQLTSWIDYESLNQ